MPARPEAVRPDASVRHAHPEPDAAADGASGAPSGLPLFLQRTVSGEQPPQRACTCRSSTARPGDTCARCGSRSLQRTLVIGSNDDPLELEADRVADHVSAAQAPVAGAVSPLVQRTPGRASAPADAMPASVEGVLVSPGQPLEPTLRTDMEQRFGHDFSPVRIHVGAAAEQSARDVNARAYTVGHDIVFGAGRFAPATPDGRRLIAHELTHIVQQAPVGGPGHGHDVAASLQRSPDKDLTDTRRPPTGRELASLEKRAHALVTRADTALTQLTAFAEEAVKATGDVHGRFVRFIDDYRTAYDGFAKALKQAKAEEERRAKLIEALEHVMVGVGIGMGVGILARGLQVLKGAAEAAGEAVSLWAELRKEVVSHAIHASIGLAKGVEHSTKFDPPLELSADRVASEHWEQLAGLWRLVAELAPAIGKFAMYAITIHDVEANLGFFVVGAPRRARGSAAENRTGVERAEARDDAGTVQRALDQVKQAFADHLQLADTPLLDRSFDQIRQDIWIQWAAGLDASDEDTVEEMLREQGVIEATYITWKGARLLFRDIGFWSTRFYAPSVRQAVALEKQRIDQIGRLGVVVINPSREHSRYWGVVHVRHDTYAALNRTDPDPKRDEPYFSFSWSDDWGREYPQRGEVVMISDTADDVKVRRLSGAAGAARLSVSDDELSTGLGLGRRGLISLADLQAEEAERQRLMTLGPVTSTDLGPFTSGGSGLWPGDPWSQQTFPPTAAAAGELDVQTCKALGFDDDLIAKFCR